MYLNNLHIINYKSLQSVDVELSTGINCFVGDNGAGKTNLIDAIYYLAFCKSFIGTADIQNITYGNQFFVLQGTFVRNGEHEEIYCGYKRNQKKQFKRNKKEYDRLADHIGFIPMVIVSPNDEFLITEGAEERRKYMDGVISQYDRNYLFSLMRYNRLLQQRNALLKQWRDNGEGDASLLTVLDQQMSDIGGSIFDHRTRFVDALLPVFSRYYKLLSDDAEDVGLLYKSGLQRYNLAEGLAQSRQRDIALGYTSRGIHKDELELMLGNHLIKKTGSQGQKKSFLIALKLAQYEFLSKHNGFNAVLLLDDIFDKLDLKRGANLVSIVAHNNFSQIFITDTNRAHLEMVVSQTGKEFKFFDVSSGEVVNNQ